MIAGVDTDKRRDLLAIMEGRRRDADQFAWAVPAVVIASQAFLLTIALDGDASPLRRLIAAGAAFVLLLGAAHQFWKQAFHFALYEAVIKRERKEMDAPLVDRDSLLVGADTLEARFQRENALGEKVAFVDKHRKRLVEDAEEETERARDRYLSAIAEAERARADLIGMRETTVWAAVYPSDTLMTYAPSHALVAGRPRESRRHGFQSAVIASAAFDLLRDDAEVLTTLSTREQAAAMQGTTTAALSGEEAMWAGSDEDVARQQRERERVIAAGGSTTVDALKHLEAQRHGMPPLGTP
jgi:hypothetical protein